MALTVEEIEAVLKLKDELTGKLQQVMNKGAQSTSILEGAVGKLAAAFTFVKLASFGAEILNTAGHLQDLHERTRINVESLQKFGLIATQGGSSLDAVANAVFQMGRRFAGGDANASDAVAELGLNFSSLRAMRPEDAFVIVGKAIANLDDPMKQAQLGSAIFGRSVGELLPTLGHLNELTEKHITLSADQVRLLDAIGDGFTQFKASLIPTTVALIDHQFQLTNSWVILKTWLGAIELAKVGLGPATDAVNKNAKAIADQAAQALHGMEFNIAVKNAEDELTEALAEKDKRMKEVEATSKKYTATLKEMHTDILKIENVLLGVRDSIGFVDDYERENIKTILERDKASRDYYNKVGERERESATAVLAATAQQQASLRAYYNWVGEQEMELLANRKTVAQAIMASFSEFPKLLIASFTGGGGISGALNALGATIGDGLFGEKGALSGAMKAATGGLKKMFGQTLGGAFAAAIPGIGSLIGPALSALWSGIKSLFGGPSKAEVSGREVVGQFEAQVGAMLSATQRLEAGNVGWKETVIAVRDAYIAAGRSAAEGEAAVAKLWASSKDGPEAARAAAAEIQAVIDKSKEVGATLSDSVSAAGFKTKAELETIAKKAQEMYEYIRTSGLFTAADVERAWQESQAAQDAAFGKTKGAVDELSARYKTLSDSVAKEAPEKFMGVMEKRARAEMAVLKAQMDAQRKSLDADAARVTKALEDALGDVKVRPIPIKVEWKIPPLNIPGAQNIKGFAEGGPVTRTGLAFLHAGEFVVPSTGVDGNGGDIAGVSDSRAIVGELVAVQRLLNLMPKQMASAIMTAGR